MVSWDKHIDRGKDRNFICYHIKKDKGPLWLQALRSEYVSNLANCRGYVRSMTAGVLGTRQAPGRPKARWEEGIEAANEFLKCTDTVGIEAAWSGFRHYLGTQAPWL